MNKASVLHNTGIRKNNPVRYIHLILLTTILESDMVFLDTRVVGIAIPTIQVKLHTTISSIEGVVNA